MIPMILEACKDCELIECNPSCPIRVDMEADEKCDRLLEEAEHD